MKQSEDTTNRIRQWLTRTFPLAQERGVGLHDSLLDSGIVDSLGTLEIVQFLESELGIQVTDEEMVGDNFESIYAIAQFADSKLHACSANTNAP